jgi:hypothetical protein
VAGLTSSWILPKLVQLVKGRNRLLPSEAGGEAANWELLEEMLKTHHQY